MADLIATMQAAAGALGGDKLYVEDVFSTYLYTGNGSTQTITNGIDLDGEGGLVWIKCRSVGYNNNLWDTERGATNYLISNLTNAQASSGAGTGVSAFNADGFTLGSGANLWNGNETYASWTFRKNPKFFNVVTWSGDGTGARSIPHGLDSTPGFYTTKITNTTSNWHSWHRSLASGYGILLNSTNTASTSTDIAGADATNINVTSSLNINGENYVAYIFAHDAGGFGEDGEQNVISCGTFGVSSGSDGVVNLGWEPQFVIIKQATTGGSGNWYMFDNMRGIPTGGNDYKVYANTSGAETFGSDIIDLSATGFTIKAGSVQGGSNYIYIAIRRPMKTPESGTEVFAPVLQDFDGFVNTGFVTDLIFGDQFTGGNNWRWLDRLRGETKTLNSNNTNAEGSASYWKFDYNNGVALTFGGTLPNWMWYNFRRAPGFFDVVAYTGTGVAHTEAHNLGVAPELMIVKKRSGNGSWCVYHDGVAVDPETDYLFLESTAAASDSTSFWNDTAPTSTNFTVGTYTGVNLNGETFVAYLFATVAGVSKVGSYTGTAANLDVDCGFSAGARFILIKRTDSTGDWYVWDSARGIIAGNDPYLLLNSTAAEVTSTDYIDPLASGFTVTSSAPAALNASGGNYIFLAIA